MHNLQVSTQHGGAFRLLFPHDFGTLAAKAMGDVNLLRANLDARLFLLHVFPPKADAGEQDLIWKRLGEYAADFRGAKLPRVLTLTGSGKPEEVIVRTARDIGADLVVFGTKGGSGLRDTFIGSAVNHVIRHTPCPVLTIREGRALPGFSQILVPVDLDGDARMQLRWALWLARMYGSRLHLLSLVSGKTTAAHAGKLEDLKQQVEAAEVKLGSAEVQSLRGKGVAEEVLALADARKADLICLMTQGASGSLTSNWMGSVADKVVNKSLIAVFSIPPGSRTPM
ncbi:MAG: universal stress protein [Bacteroidota bacterium]